MAWEDLHGLKTRINSLPLILAGPILRRVEFNTVTVWVALKESGTIKLDVFEGGDVTPLFSGSRATIALGKQLHVAAVTATPLTSTLLTHGKIYTYDLEFSDGTKLSTRPEGPNFKYSSFTKPSFALPPDIINSLRLVHGSCRLPHGLGMDALAALDGMILSTADDANHRPHQLFLTGDQIYSDDVADGLLYMLRDASDSLLDWKETLPDIPAARQAELKPGQRDKIAEEIAKLTGMVPNKPEYAKSHMFTLGEWFLMYLFVWSDALWPTTFPGFADVYPGVSETRPLSHNPLPFGTTGNVDTETFSAFKMETAQVKNFQSTLKAVRRALANVPTYMVFDDHEVTDDWNINRDWCKNVLGSKLGRRIMQNALTAFAIFQAWGNTPDQFETGKPGAKLLKGVEDWAKSNATDNTARQKINEAISVPDDLTKILKKVDGVDQLTHLPDSLDWHYLIKWPTHEVVALDTRTCRAYPGAGFDFPVLLTQEAYRKQIPDEARSDAPVRIVISAFPVVFIPLLEEKQRGMASREERLDTDCEGWGLQPLSFEELIARLANTGQVNRGNTLTARDRIVFFSGDVHCGYAARLQYWANQYYLNDPLLLPVPGGAELVAAQLTSSGFKKETPGLKAITTLHWTGFQPLEATDNLPLPKTSFGWKNPGGGPKEMAELEVPNSLPFLPPQKAKWVERGDPIIKDIRQIPYKITRLKAGPDWEHRMDFILAESEVRAPAPVTPKSVPPPPPGDRKKALKSYLAMSSNHASYTGEWGDGKEIVGLNNIGEISFEGTDETLTVVQQLWWRLEGLGGKVLEPFPLTKLKVSLKFNDSKYPQENLL